MLLFKYIISFFQDPVGELKKIQRHLGLNLSDKRLKEVLARCSLDKLKEDVINHVSKSPVDFPVTPDYLYRKGIFLMSIPVYFCPCYCLIKSEILMKVLFCICAQCLVLNNLIFVSLTETLAG